MAKECYAPCGAKLIGLSPLEAGVYVRRSGVLLRNSPSKIQQELERTEVSGMIIKHDPGSGKGEETIGYLEHLGFEVGQESIPCPYGCGDSLFYCSKVRL
jgi:hypothetical protein